MVFTTHAVVGGALARLTGLPPGVSFLIGMVSHYFLDSLPHWDYSLGSYRENDGKKSLNNDIALDRTFIRDLFKLIPDFILGFFLAMHFFGSSDFSTVNGIKNALYDPVLWGAFGGVFPDGLQFLYFKIKKEPLITIQKFHTFMATKNEIKGTEAWYITGVIAQLAIVFLCIYFFRI